MRVRWNGTLYDSWTELRGQTDDSFTAFLEEWFDEKPWIIGHTSGSTGTPKEIRLLKEDMKASARLTNDFLGIGPESVLLLCLSASYIAGKMMIVRALEAGAELIAGEVSSRPLKNIRGGDRPIDLTAMVPMQVEETLKCPEEMAAFLSIRKVLIGGAPLAPGLEEYLGRLAVCCYATYGMTETVSHIALRKLGSGGLYHALGQVTFSADSRGCLVIHAPHLRQGKFVTNDLVELLCDTAFRWCGRWDHVINSGGIKHSPEIIEHKISELIPGRFFIAGQPDERLGERIVLVIEGNYPGKESSAAVLDRLKSYLTPYEMPKAVFYCPVFRETASGKVIRDLTGLTPVS